MTKRLIQLGIFLSIVTITILSAMLFILNRIDVYFNINLYWLTILMFIFPIAVLLDKFYLNTFTTKLYTVSWFTVGSTLILWTSFVIIAIISYFLPITPQTTGILSISLGFFWIILSVITAEKTVITKYKIPLNNIKKQIKIVQITDIHLGTIHTKRFTQKITNIVNKLKPKYVFIVGDMFDGSGKVTDDMLNPLKKIKAKKFFTIGNHELYIDDKKIEKQVSKIMPVIRDKYLDLKEIQIIGVDNPKTESIKKSKTIDNLNKKIKPQKPSIILLHTPTAIQSFKESKANIMLSGHTHAGQIFPLNLLVKLKHKYVYGLHKIKDKFLIISSGVGSAGPPMRLFTKSEIVEITLIPNKNL